MKKSPLLIPFFLIITYTGAFSQQLEMVDVMRTDGLVRVSDIQPAGSQMHPVAARAVSRGEKPGAFKNVTYRYAGNVRVLSQAQKNRVRLVQDGILDISGTAFQPNPDSIYVDAESDFVMQAEPVSTMQALALRPSLSMVFADIEVPEQEVPVTLANTVSMAAGIVESSVQNNNSYAVNLNFDSLLVTIDSTSEGSLKAALVGVVQITNPRIEGKYSKNKGYSLVFKASELVDLKLYATIEAKKEIKTPIWGTEMKLSDLGKCELGLFLLIDMEGRVSLSFEIHQGIDMALGAKGGTFWYIPTSIKNISTIDHWCDIDYNVMAKLKAFAGLQCTADLKIKGYDALDVYATGGMEGTVESDGSTLSADVGFRIKAGGKIISKKFTLLDNYYSLWKIQKPDYHGYEMLIHEADAWGDYVVGEISTLSDSRTVPGTKDTIPYKGQLTVIVKHSGNQTNEYPASTDDKGLFAVKNVPLKKGDKVMIKMPGVPSVSPAVEATIPFRSIVLSAVDYYAGIAEGAVAGRKSEWAALASSNQAQGQTTGNPATAALKNSVAERLKGVVSQQAAVERVTEFRNNMVVYRGPIEFIAYTPPTATLTGQPQNQSKVPAAQEKAVPNRGIVSSPMGLFQVKGLKFEPGQRVKARVTFDGFVIESDWVETEGLMVSAIESEGMENSTRPGVETVSAVNSMVVISAIRSDISPVGTVRILKGAGAPHSSVTGTNPVSEFPGATKAIVWVDKTVSLIPLEEHPGTSVAYTGPWTANYVYSSPGDAVIPDKNRKHPFEMVSYLFMDHDLGYSSFINECLSCTSTRNVIDKLGNIKAMEMPLIQQKIQVPVKQPKMNMPGVIR